MTSAPLDLRGATLVAVLAAGFLLSACAQMLISGATMGATAMYTDRRTPGLQVEDQTVEFTASSRMHDVIGDRGHITITSYNRVVLITGEVPVDADRAAVEQAVARGRGACDRQSTRRDAGIGGVHPDQRSRAARQIKATYVDAKDLQLNAFKVVVDRSTAYLMGGARNAKRRAPRTSHAESPACKEWSGSSTSSATPSWRACVRPTYQRSRRPSSLRRCPANRRNRRPCARTPHGFTTSQERLPLRESATFDAQWCSPQHFVCGNRGISDGRSPERASTARA
jgi:osmotically-inducible protein OsmY